MAVNLHVQDSGSGPAVVLLHGLFGAGSNLGSLARALRADYRVLSVDLPGHGRSGQLPGADLPGMAAAVSHWLQQAGIVRAHVLGHSLGGKVAMELALASPERVASLVVADIAPVAYPPRHQAVFAALEAVAAGACDSRDAAAVLMRAHVAEEGVVQFLLASLRREESGYYGWRFDLAGLKSAYAALSAAPAGDRVFPGAVMFLRGGASDYLRAEHWPAIRHLFPGAAVKTLAGCGHWLHADKPQLFNSTVRRFLDAQAS